MVMGKPNKNIKQLSLRTQGSKREANTEITGGEIAIGALKSEQRSQFEETSSCECVRNASLNTAAELGGKIWPSAY